ncbi:hypothetical protein RRG08_046423 [Elysia crispata]|uniref:Uncharacterized protein n=1 Tax=Elysia crispata TaxID=231223 RepID=A0AAE0Z8H0_9GAST|nr:hypothetical protein RRG08_046423 [Elysia crispata]
MQRYRISQGILLIPDTLPGSIAVFTSDWSSASVTQGLATDRFHNISRAYKLIPRSSRRWTIVIMRERPEIDGLQLDADQAGHTRPGEVRPTAYPLDLRG